MVFEVALLKFVGPDVLHVGPDQTVESRRPVMSVTYNLLRK